MSRVLIAGCGYVGAPLARLLAERGDEAWGLRRHPAELPFGVRPLAADVTDPSSLDGVRRLEPDAVVYAVSPSERSPGAYRSAYVEGLRNVLDAAFGRGRSPGRAVLVGSTGVYGHGDGRWVDEETPPDPADATGEALLEAEALVREMGAPGVVLRLGGIYGPGRDRLVRRVLDGSASCPPEGRYSNRIHRDDAAAAALHLLDLDAPRPVYLGVDREPAELRVVYRWIADRAGVPDPCRSGVASAAGGGRRGTNKRCSSDRLVKSGFRHGFPTFREGYGALLREMGGGAAGNGRPAQS